MAYYYDHDGDDGNSTITQADGFRFAYDKFDRGHKIVKRQIVVPNTLDYNGSPLVKWKNVHVYVSSGIGSIIRDAETGQTFPGYIVGSKDEDLLFKVSITTGSKTINGLNTAFYQSPTHYKNHLHEKIGLDMEQRWNTKRIQRIRELALEESKRQERMRTVIY